jgi:hypothetical protein
MQRSIQRGDVPAWIDKLETMTADEVGNMVHKGSWQAVHQAVEDLCKDNHPQTRAAGCKCKAALTNAAARYLEAMAKLHHATRAGGEQATITLTREQIWAETADAPADSTPQADSKPQ